jgi:hypothetical protein
MVPLRPAKFKLCRVCSFWTEAIMQDITLIGIDLGKHSFHVHGQDRLGHRGAPHQL